ncbi:hypothetical protein NADE_005154 [Nannochloris sp. 'desiccata']|nr:hypothetical protein NADE_005154 [Chlorella desiccata (nom. nud.)]
MCQPAYVAIFAGVGFHATCTSLFDPMSPRRSAAQLSTTALMREKRLQRLETFGSASGGASTTSVGNALPAPERIMVTNGTPAIVYKF